MGAEVISNVLHRLYNTSYIASFQFCISLAVLFGIELIVEVSFLILAHWARGQVYNHAENLLLSEVQSYHVGSKHNLGDENAFHLHTFEKDVSIQIFYKKIVM